ncbi:MAG: nuclear transport factor 2 family protein [Bdellovibrionaceae bacterium]|nr:nuclear transport factor 2 family protein [Pseudobdellovibrionaceae bacterium]
MKTQDETQANIQVVKTYFDSLAKGDLNTLGSLFADDVLWHQPGNGSLSGTHKGKQDVFSLFGKFMEASEGSFRINSVDSIMANGDLVSATLTFSAQKKSGANMSMSGVDVMRIENGKIKEVYLFSGDQKAEDQFWG